MNDGSELPLLERAEEIFERAQPQEERLALPRWRGAVRIVEPDYETMRRLVIDRKANDETGTTSIDDDVALVAACVRTGQGELVFSSPEHVERLKRTDWDSFTKVLRACRQVAGLSTKTVEQRVGESEGAPSSSS